MRPLIPARIIARMAILGLLSAPGVAIAASDAEALRWQALQKQFFAGKEIADGSNLISLEAPYRAHDAALVPIDIQATFPQSDKRYIKKVTLMIDMNPVPMAGRFHFTPASGVVNLSTRVRVNAYTNVRAIAETNDGKLFMTTKYVKASGGCSAPAGKDQDAALARLGKMKLRQAVAAEAGQPHRAQLLISHPNSTGMQMDQVSRHYVPAHFINNIDVSYQGESVLRVESDISLSEDPSIHFNYVPRGGGEMRVDVTDSTGKTFTKAWPVSGGEAYVKK